MSPDFVKIDIEGMEYEVLSSINESLMKNILSIYIEVNDDPKFKDSENINDFLVRKGFIPAFPNLDFIPGFSSKSPGRRKSYNRLWVKKI